MVIVYFETPDKSYSEQVAIFDNNAMYNECLLVLEKMASYRCMIVTESVVPFVISDFTSNL